jgi:DNA repair protein RecO (recombination protein O)
MAAGNFIILKTMAFKESDLVVHALNSRGGKEHFLARSALKSKKRFGGGVLEPLNYVHLTYDDRKEKTEFVPLTEAKLIDGFEGLRKDYDRLRVALNMLKDMFKITVEGSQDAGPLFNLLGNTLKKLEITEDIPILQLHYRIKMLYYSGYLPNEDGAFNAFLEEPVGNSEKLKKHITPYLKSISDNALRELGVF